MAMLRVSSYRKLFEDEHWNRSGGLGVQCAGQFRASFRRAAVDECDCDKLDLVAARSLNKEGLNQFAQDRTVIAALNDRLVGLIELARCFEEENESLECQIVELEEKLNSQQASSSITSTVAQPDYSLDAVLERLRKERDEILRDTEELHKELEGLQDGYEKAAQQRIFYQQERQDVAEEVDAVTAECLALREQVAIYEEQLANMEAQHTMAVGSLLEPADGTTGAVAAFGFCSPDMTPALDVKEYYCQLAESLQFKCGAAPSAVVRSGDRKQLEGGQAVGSRVENLPKIKDSSELKMLISELQKELTELEMCNAELEDEVEMKKAAYMEEIAELKFTIDEMRHKDADLQAQMTEQCEDYKELLSEKMARDMEIVAYRSLVEEEEERLCYL
ncbi:putative desmin-like [Scophthalmus maximus]|uniref:Putative desmin-like n=1 Tax=Scophthalmus maximus TaxID=52904 RepID=A0A2U9C5K1_SCOMX|nr:putative desmin-like [Scophthalmus maximus]